MGYNESDISIVSNTDDEHKKLDDEVYIEKCNDASCINYDSRGFCRYETCVLKADILPKQHATFMRNCAVCGNDKDFANLRGDICIDCMSRIINKLLKEG
jgi:hypothetical protein